MWGERRLNVRIPQASAALPPLRADGAAVIESEHEVLVRFYFDSPPFPGLEGAWTDDVDADDRVVEREIVATLSLSPQARGIYTGPWRGSIMSASEVRTSDFGATRKYAPQPWRDWMPVEGTKQPRAPRPRPRFRHLIRSVARTLRLRPSGTEVASAKQGTSWVVEGSAKEGRFQVIDDEGGVIDTWRLRASIARFERGEGQRVDLDAVRERFGLKPGE